MSHGAYANKKALSKQLMEWQKNHPGQDLLFHLVAHRGAGTDGRVLNLLHACRRATPPHREPKRVVSCRMCNKTRGPVSRRRKLMTCQDSKTIPEWLKLAHRTRR